MALMEQIVYNQNESYDWKEIELRLQELSKDLFKKDEVYRFSFAYSFCHKIVSFLWKHIDISGKFKLQEISYQAVELDYNLSLFAYNIASFLIGLSPVQCGAHIGSIYTALLPRKYRSQNGIYYTPHIIAERLLDVLTVQGVAWDIHTVIDPACGGGAFLVPVINRIIGHHRVRILTSEEKLELIEHNVRGIEIDPFGAWITKVLIDVILYPEYIKANRRLKNIVLVGNTLTLNIKDQFDLVVGNPPFGRVSLASDLRKKYERSLYGHANLYGLFLDEALRLGTPEGLIGFILPTSFLGGVYFKNLRRLLSKDAPLINIDFISERSGVFANVLQETCIAVFGKKQGPTSVASLTLQKDTYHVENVGSCTIESGIKPWIIPRELTKIDLIKNIKHASATLKDYGYKVSTGPLVWNRHKKQLREKFEKGLYPIIWSEAINKGTFTFDYTNRTQKFIDVFKNQEGFLLCREQVLLVHRTTAKEQERRIISSILPREFIEEWGACVVENHVNMIIQEGKPLLSMQAMQTLLNSKIIDQLFRCISGSVAVSASELSALPLPAPDKLCLLNDLFSFNKNERANQDLLRIADSIICKAYGIPELENSKWIG